MKKVCLNSKVVLLLNLFLLMSIVSFSQKTKKDTVRVKPVTIISSDPLQQLEAFFLNVKSVCKSFNSKAAKDLLADNLKNNRSFLKEWEIDLNNSDAAIWHTICPLPGSPYVIDSSNKTKITCKVPFIKDGKKVANSSGILQILPLMYLDVANQHDVILSEPDAQSKPIGKVKPGEQYRYFVGTTKYSASLKQYVTDAIPYDGEGTIGFYAIELDAKQHKLGYISTNATYNSMPLVQLQFIKGQWKIIKLDYQD